MVAKIEIAKKVKELGFSETVFNFWTKSIEGDYESFNWYEVHKNKWDKTYYIWMDLPAPTYAEVIDFLLKEYGIFIYPLKVGNVWRNNINKGISFRSYSIAIHNAVSTVVNNLAP